MLILVGLGTAALLVFLQSGDVIDSDQLSAATFRGGQCRAAVKTNAVLVVTETAEGTTCALARDKLVAKARAQGKNYLPCIGSRRDDISNAVESGEVSLSCRDKSCALDPDSAPRCQVPTRRVRNRRTGRVEEVVRAKPQAISTVCKATNRIDPKTGRVIIKATVKIRSSCSCTQECKRVVAQPAAGAGAPAQTVRLFGDANKDGVLDRKDFEIRGSPDMNSDGSVTTADFILWRQAMRNAGRGRENPTPTDTP